MQRHAFKMQLKPGRAEVYRRRHEEIWPELERELAAAGVVEYLIFLDESTNTLLAVQWLKEGHRADKLPESPVVRQWWDFMADVVQTGPGNTPVVIPLKEMYHMGTPAGPAAGRPQSEQDDR